MLGSFKYIFVLSFYHLSIFQGYYKDIVEFYFDERNHCKNFWKKCVEHHGFFRYLYYQIIKWGVAHNCLLAMPCCGDRSESWQFVSYKLTANRPWLRARKLVKKWIVICLGSGFIRIILSDPDPTIILYRKLSSKSETKSLS